MINLEKLQRLHETATPGPWSYDGMHPEIHAYHEREGAFLISSELREHPGDSIPDQFGHAFNPNFELIVEVRNILPELIAEIEVLRGKNTKKPVLPEHHPVGDYKCPNCMAGFYEAPGRTEGK